MKLNSIILLVVLLSGSSCRKERDTIKPTLQPITESVYSSVTIQPDSFYAVYASVSGLVDHCLVTEGDLIKREEGLMQIISTTADLAAENQRLEWQQVKANYDGQATVLREISSEVSAAQLAFQHDSINFARQKRLFTQKIGSASEYERRKLAYETSLLRLNSLQNNYERTRDELETRLTQARNQYENSLIKHQDHTVKSMIDGKVYALLKKPGELVSPQEPIAYVGSADRFVIEMQVDEIDITHIRYGQNVLIVLDAYEGQWFEAKISKIFPRMEPRLQTFQVEALFTSQPPVLYAGLTGEANIIIKTKEEAITIPLEYLQEDHQVQTTEGWEPVTTGLQNLEFVEITTGLDTNCTLIKPE